MGEPTFLETGHMTEGFPIRVIHTSRQFNYASHWHEEVEMVVVRGKNAKIRVYNRLYELEQGDILIIKPGDVHCFLPGTDQLTILLFRLELITGSFVVTEDAKEMIELFIETTLIPSTICCENNLSSYLDILSNESTKQQAGYRWSMIARFYDLIVHLLRIKTPTSETSKSGRVCSPTKKFEFIQSICGYLEEHYADNIRLDQVAEHVKFSKFYVCTLFKEIKGITLMEYLNHFRIIKSEWALLFSKDSILTISIKHGFNNINSYNRLFKKYNNCTPTEFRKKHCTKNTTYGG